jgi:UDP-N-acetylmuramoyl-L-alanyl-D-glutamate--2,6-diaminopimelate ligase
MSLRSTVKKVIPSGVFPAIEPYGHLAEAVLFNTINGFPSRGLQVIGVTGTNGKTTTCFMIHRMLTDAGYKVGLLTTVAYGVGEDIKPQLYHMTSVPVPELMRRIKAMRAAKVDYVVLETTSHALAQHRVWGIPYSLAVLTNLTHEHLAYHRTFERYRDAKRLMFQITNRNKKGLRVGVINADDPNASFFAKDVQHPILYGLQKGSVRATDVKVAATGVKYRVQIGEDSYVISCQLPGTFNVYNSLAAVCVGHVLGLTKPQIEQGIAALKGVEGRMNRIEAGQSFDLIVDYAHTPDSFEILFKDLRPVVTGKIIVVFGSLGGGDRGKRPLQGELAGKYADEVILCEEDDRKEDGQAIIDEIAVGAKKAGKVLDKDLFFIHDRTEAITEAVSRAKKGDTVLLLGKGHEKTIEHADGEHPWNESDEAKKAVQRSLKSAKS